MGRHEVIVLDTHVLIWFTKEDTSIGKQSRAAYDQAIKSNEAAISVVSSWELGIYDASFTGTLR